MKWLVPLVLAALALAGCMSGSNSEALPKCSAQSDYVTGNFEGSQNRDPSQAWDAIMWSDGVEWMVEKGNVELQTPWPGHLAVVHMEPQLDNQPFASNPPAVSGIDVSKPESPCEGPYIAWPNGIVRDGAPEAEIGKGVLVKTAGFWENGTLFYTNIAEIDADWPARASWYASGGDDPLQVYVYGDNREEMPPYWGGATRDLPDLPVGLPSGPTEYFTTIPGFNEALKGLSTSTTIVAHMAPEDAYTRDGNEEHPLYGDALVFLIHIEAIADQPCPQAAPDLGCFRR